jgi:hypothetical protein
MFTKAVAIAVIAALAEPANAFNAHRHLHEVREVADKRDMFTHWVTEHQTVTVVAGQEAAAAPSNNPPPPVVNNKQVQHEHVQEPPPVVAEPTQPAPEVAQPTTLVPQVKPSKTQPVKQEEPTGDSPSPSTGDGVFSSKRGMAYNNATLANMFGSTCASCDWAHNWGSAPDVLDNGYSFVPTLWGTDAEFTDNWHVNAKAAIDAGAKAIFSFNEPDIDEQANIPDAAIAAQAHADWIGQYHGDVLIAAPSVSNSGEENRGLKWLGAFMAACEGIDGCEVDFCNVHWYSEPEWTDTLFEHLDDAHEACGGKPIWLTEFAPNDASDQQKSDFISYVIPKLEDVEYLDAYSYFWIDEGLVAPGPGIKSISSFGQVYASI